MRSTIVVVALSVVVVAATAVLRTRPASDDALARRLLLLTGDPSAPKIVLRDDPEVLQVVTAHGRIEFVRQPPCDERFACAFGFTLLCWDAAPTAHSRSAKM